MNARMSEAAAQAAQVQDWRAEAQWLADAFAARAAQHDEGDEFVAENYQALKASGLLAAGVPAELGGGGLELEELCEMLRTLARGCANCHIVDEN